jgi:hypothetical protein
MRCAISIKYRPDLPGFSWKKNPVRPNCCFRRVPRHEKIVPVKDRVHGIFGGGILMRVLLFPCGLNVIFDSLFRFLRKFEKMHIVSFNFPQSDFKILRNWSDKTLRKDFEILAISRHVLRHSISAIHKKLSIVLPIPSPPNRFGECV